jgi:hypothetical protein
LFNLLPVPARAQDPLLLPAGRLGAPYSAQIKSEGGMAPLSWRVSGGQLPPGLAVSSAGKIDGTPTAAAKQPFTFELTVSDSSEPPQSAVQRFSIVIAPPPLRIVGVTTVSSTAPLKIVGANLVNSPGDSAPATVAALAADPAAPTVASTEAVSSRSPIPAANAPSIAAQPEPDPPQGAPAAAAVAYSITPSAANVCAGGSVSLTATGSDAATTSWGVTPQNAGTFNHTSSSANTTFTTDSGLKENAAVVFTGTANGQTANVMVTIGAPCIASRLGGEIVRAVIGFEQVGASSTSGAQSFMFDFFLTRPVPFFHYDGGDNIWGPRLRWWGDVRVSSFPYTQKSSVATFAQQFASAFGTQNLNQLAQSIETVTGPEIRIWTTGSHGSITDKDSAARFGLTWFAGAGATGPNNPTDNATVFDSPVASSSQDTLLRSLFPTAPVVNCPAPTTPPGAACTSYVAFVPRSADRFLQQWSTGFRLYTLYTEKSSAKVSFGAPATVEFSIGQNAAVTESHLHNFVGHAAAMYPFSIGPRGESGSVVIYLFGEVNTAFAKNHFQNTLTLIPALDSNGSPIPVSSPSVVQIPVDSNRRDTYRIGVGVDLVTVWKSLMTPKSGS